jgi:hypothetical protein
MLRLEAVSVSVGCGDFLDVTARHNAGLFDRWVIVTTPSDAETREVCRKHNLETVLTEDFGRDGADFAKARGINRGLEVLSADCWYLHLDADIILPPTFRQLLEAAHLDETCLYGWDRVMIRSWQEYERYRNSGFLHHDYGCRVKAPPGLEIGTRWVSPHYGFCPIGHGQLWHDSADRWWGVRTRRYPERHNSAARCDVQFSLLFDRRKRVFLPEIISVHLESEPAPLGANWKGRKTRRFGPPESGQVAAAAS